MYRDEIQLDFEREERIGLEEAVFAQGKPDGHLVEILREVQRRGRSILLTRMSAEQVRMLPDELRVALDYEPISRTAVFGTPRPVRGRAEVAIVTAGTSDAFVSREAARTLAYHGVPATTFGDVGLAGLHRVLGRLDAIREHSIVIVVAGMDAALPTVVGGLVSRPVIAVPTSVGYGVAAGGESALRATLATCSAGVLVTNIDNGFGAACAALRMLHAFGRSPGRAS